jgi:regulator of RNase E activity RraB
MNLKDTSIGNVEEMMSNFADEKMSLKTKRRIASYMSAIAVNAFRLGYQVGKEEMTVEQFNELLFGKNTNRELSSLMNEITFRVSI